MIDGYVGHDVEWRDHEVFGGRSSFSVGVTPRSRRDDGGWQDKPTMWFKVTCWRQFGQQVRDSIKKGDPVTVKGVLRLNQWVDQNGTPKFEAAINATWVGHDLRRGTTTFARRSGRPELEAPERLTPDEVARLAAMEAQYDELDDPGEFIDPDGVVHEAEAPF